MGFDFDSALNKYRKDRAEQQSKPKSTPADLGKIGGQAAAKVTKQSAPAIAQVKITQRYGTANPTVADVSKQAEAIAQWDTDVDVTTFLKQAVEDGVVTPSEAESIFGKTTGGSLFSQQNQQKVTAETSRRMNGGTPVWRTQQVNRDFGNYTAEQAKAKLEELHSKKDMTPYDREAFSLLLSKTDSKTAKSYLDKAKEKKTKDLKEYLDNNELRYLNELEMLYPEAVVADYTANGTPIGYSLNPEKLKSVYKLTDEDVAVIIEKNNFTKTRDGIYSLRVASLKVRGIYEKADYAASKKDVEERQGIYEELKWQETIQPYVDEAMSDKDFASKSKYSGNAKTTIGMYINGESLLPSPGEKIYPMDGDDAFGLGMAENEYLAYHYVTPEERDIYNYYVNTNKPEKAYEFAKKLEPILNKRAAMASQEEFSEMAKQYPVTANALSVALNVGTAPNAGVEFLSQMVTGEEFDPYAPGFRGAIASETIRGTTSEMIKNDVARFFYNAGMSMVDSAAVMPMGGVGVAFLGTNAAVAEGRKTALEGGNKWQVFSKGAAAGIAEAWFEKIGLDNLFSPKAVGGFKSALKTVLKQAGIEASEEFLTSVTNNFIDDIAMGGESQFYKKVESYIEQGMSPYEAKWQATMDMGGETLLEALAGAVSGGAFGGGGAVINYTNAVNTGKQINAQGNKDTLIGFAKMQGSDSAAYKDAVKLSGKKNVKNAEIGALLQQMVIDKQITPEQANGFVTEGINGIPLSEAEQSFLYAGANGMSAMEASSMLSDLDVDPERAIKAWQIGTQHRTEYMGKETPTTLSMLDISRDDMAKIKKAEIDIANEKTARSLEGDTSAPYVSSYAINRALKRNKAEATTNTEETPAVQNTPVKAVKFKGEAYEQAKAYKTEANAKDFEYAYTQGFNRVKPSEDINLEDVAINAAYLAGVSDSRAVVSSRANFEARTPGLDLVDTVSRDIAGTLDDSARATINNIGKKLGVKIMLTNRNNEIAGGNTKHSRNSSYNFKNGVVTINVDEIHIGLKGRKLKKNELVRFILAHEGTHRLQETSPEAYAEMEKVALSKSNMTLEEYMEKWNISDEAEARGEIVADYFGDLLSTKAEVKALLNENRSLWDKILEVIDWLIYKLKGAGVAYNDILEARELFRQALNEADATVWGKDVRGDNTDALSRSETVDKKKKTSYYSYYNTEVMKWAYATNRKPGDLKILHNGKQHVLLEGTADGYVELYKGKYKEVEDKYERMLRETDDSFYAYSKKIRSEQKRNMRDLQYDKNGRNDDKNAGQNGSERLQADTTGSNEHLRRSNKRESLTDDVLLSRSESEYLELAKDPVKNEAKLRKMVEEAARNSMPNSKITTKDGKLRIVFHGTNTGDFTVFNPDYIGMSSGDDGFFGMGFYFAFSEGEASYYGAKRIIPAYLDLKNPFNFDKELQTYKGKKAQSGYAPDAVAFMNFADKFPEIAKNITVGVLENGGTNYKDLPMADFAKAFKDVIENKKFEYQEVTNEYGEKETLVLADPQTYEYESNGKTHKYKDYGFQKRFWGRVNDLDVAYEYLSNSVYSQIYMVNRTRLILDNNREFTNALKKMGYDGAIQSEFGDEAVAFYSEQIKSADLVTYDDNGNIIPLSERFNDKKNDIRWSRSDDSEYLDLAKNPEANKVRLREMLDERARKAGFPTRVYHGTNRFGFTEVKATKGDDGLSFWATDSLETAGTYSGSDKTRSLKEEYEEGYIEVAVIFDSLMDLIYEKLPYEEETGNFDMFENKAYDLFTGLDQGEYGIEEVLTNVYELLDDGFVTLADSYYDEIYEEYSEELYEDYKKTAQYSEMKKTYYAYVDKIMHLLRDADRGQGIYDLYANTDGFLRIECNGANWNSIPFSSIPFSPDEVKALEKHFKTTMPEILRTRWVAKAANFLGYKGVIFNNLRDSAHKKDVEPAGVYAFFNPESQVKSADLVTYDENGNIIPLSERFDDKKSDIRWSRSEPEKTFAKGEAPRRDIDVPSEVGGKKVMRGARTTAEAEGINEDYAFNLVEEIRNGNFTYEVSSNKAVALKATNEVNENYDEAKAKWDGIIMSGKRVTPEDIALGEALLVEASHRRSVEETLKINAEVAMLATEAGQVVQAMRILKRLSPSGQLRYLEVVTDRINAERQKTKGKKYSRLIESENEVANANKKYQEADKKVKNLEKKSEEILNTINQLQSELESEDRIANLEEQEKALKKEIAMLKKELAKESDASGKEKIREQIKLIEEDIKENASQLKDALDEKSRLVSERNAMGKELTAIKNAKKATDNAVEKLAGDMALLENEIAELDSQLEKATKFKKELEEELSKLRKERRTIKDKIKRREDSSEKAFAEIEPLENEIAELKEKLEVANTALNEVTERRNALRDERNKLRDKVKRREGAIEREATRTKEITNQIAQLLDDLYNADLALEEAKANRKAVDEARQRVNEIARYAQSKAGKVVLPDDLKAKILQAQNEDELKAAMEIATDYIAANVKTTWAEKIRAWRYLAMLGNARTIFRNLLGNVFMNIPVAAKNVFAYPMELVGVPLNNAIVNANAKRMAEKGISQETIDSYLDRSIAYKTQTLKVFKKRSEDIKKFVKESWDTNLKVAMEGGKYDSTSMADEIESKRVIFKNKAIEAWRKVTNWAMEGGDLVFVQFNYKQALTRFMLANNLNPETITQAERAKAEAYAIKEAQEATFRDKSKLAEGLNNLKKINWATELAFGGLFPFTKTPINVMKRSFEYSPLGIFNMASDIVEAVKGTKNVTDVINSAAKTVSGSALVALGAYLAAQGFLRSTGDDEDEEYDYLAGEQDYAITIGDIRYPIDWASPTAIPLLLGASMYESYFKNDGGVKKKYFIDENGKLQEATAYMNFVDSLNKAMTLFNPVFEATYLSGFADAIETGSQFSSMPGESLIAFGTSSVLSFGKQFIPTAVSQVARIIDPIERRNNEVDQTSGIPRYAQKGVAKIKNSIPWLRESSTPYVDAWGRIPEVKDEAKDYFWSAVENLISPGYYQRVKEDDITKELWRLQKTEDGKGKNIFPDAVGNSYTQTKDKIEYTYVFNPEQKNERQMAESDAYREFAETFLNSDIYSDLTDAERIKVLAMLNSYSEAEGIKAVYKDFETGNSTVQKMYAAEAEGISPEAYALWKVAKDKADKPNKNGNMGTYTNSEKDEAIRILMKQYGIELTPTQRTSLKKNY